jgi:hypothetical protein
VASELMGRSEVVAFKKFKIKKVPKLLIATVSDIKVKKKKLTK